VEAVGLLDELKQKLIGILNAPSKYLCYHGLGELGNNFKLVTHLHEDTALLGCQWEASDLLTFIVEEPLIVLVPGYAGDFPRDSALLTSPQRVPCEAYLAETGQHPQSLSGNCPLTIYYHLRQSAVASSYPSC